MSDNEQIDNEVLEHLLELSKEADTGVEKRAKEYNNFRALNLNLSSDSPIVKKGSEAILNDIQPKMKRKFRKDKFTVSLMCLNSLMCWNEDWNRYITYGRKSGYYKSSSRYNPSSISSVIDVVDAMIECGYLEDHIKGVNAYGDLGGKLSKFRPSEKLINVFGESDGDLKAAVSSIRPHGETIILRDAEGNKIEYNDNRQTNRVRKNLEIINKANGKALLELGGEVINGRLHRVFRGGFDKGGRFYCSGYQMMAPEVRARLTINNEPVVECDFSNHHIRMLYHREKINAPGDLYSLESYGAKYRPLIKMILLISINASSFDNACRAVPGRIRKRINKLFQKAEELKSNGNETALSLQAINKIEQELAMFESVNYDDIKGIAMALKGRHEAISSFFFTGEGNTLQNLDASITEVILLDMAKQKIPCYPEHDSYIVPARYEAELKDAMSKSYFEIMENYSEIETK